MIDATERETSKPKDQAKRFKLLAGIYRGPEPSYDDIFLAIGGVHNFRKRNTLSW